MATVKINEKLVSIIKDKRKKKKLTQKDMAEYLQISFSNYQRLEANKYETYDQNLMKQIAVKLDIDDEIFSDTLKVSPTTKMALRIKNDTLKQIKMIEIEHEFDSFSQTANYIFEQYFLNHDLSKVKYDIENMFQEVVLKTWATTVKDLEKENISFVECTYIVRNPSEEEKNYIFLLGDENSELEKKIQFYTENIDYLVMYLC